MRTSTVHIDDTATTLREAFDRTFAQAPDTKSADVESLLSVRIGPDRYVLRLTEVSGLFAGKKITSVPSSVPEFLGIAGFRGTLLPVYDVGMVLGYPKTAAPRWLVVTASTPVGLAFDSFDGYISARHGTIVSAKAGDEAHQGHVCEFLQAETSRPVLHLPSVLKTIAQRNGSQT